MLTATATLPAKTDFHKGDLAEESPYEREFKWPPWRAKPTTQKSSYDYAKTFEQRYGPCETLEGITNDAINNASIFNTKQLREVTQNVLRNRDKIVKAKVGNHYLLTTIGVAYVCNWEIECKRHYSEQNKKPSTIRAREVYFSPGGIPFKTQEDYELIVWSGL